MNPSATFALRDITPDEVWDRLHVQIFRDISDVQECQAYLVQNWRASPLGCGFGGYGITSMCVADLDGSGRDELLFSYSWGSGIHRSLVGMWTGGTTWSDAPQVLRDWDLELHRVDAQHVTVTYRLGAGDAPSHPGERGVFGTLRLVEGPGGAKLEIVLDPALPGWVRDHLWGDVTSAGAR